MINLKGNVATNRMFCTFILVILSSYLYADTPGELKTAVDKYRNMMVGPGHREVTKEDWAVYYDQLAGLVSKYPHIGDHVYWEAMKILVKKADLNKRIDMLRKTIPMLIEPNDRFWATGLLIRALREDDRHKEAEELFARTYTQRKSHAEFLSDTQAVETLKDLSNRVGIDIHDRLDHVDRVLDSVVQACAGIANDLMIKAEVIKNQEYKDILLKEAMNSWQNAGRACIRKGKIDKALKYFQKALDAAKQVQGRSADRIILQREMAVGFLKAEQSLVPDYDGIIKLVKANQDNGNLPGAIIMALVDCKSEGIYGDKQKARYLSQVITHIPEKSGRAHRKTHARLYGSLGKALWNLGMKSRALKTIQQACDLFPENQHLKSLNEDYSAQ